MQFWCFSALLVISLPLFVAGGKLYTEDFNEQKLLWEDYKKTHQRSYEGKGEEMKRFTIFLDNLKRLDQLQANGNTRVGISKFSDMTKEEFKNTFLNTKFPTSEEMAAYPRFQDNVITPTVSTCPVENIEVNWEGVYTTPVKDQGYCGSCWSFSTAEQVESDLMRTLNTEYILSEEQLLDCNTEYPQSGCDGGVVAYAMEYLISNSLEQNISYPYTSYYNTAQKSCNYQPSEGVVKLSTFYAVVQDETCMAYYIQNYGPLSIAVNADTWNDYPLNTGNVWSGVDCGNGQIDHAVQLVGVNIPGNYWIIRNSWGTNWGNNGYINVQYGVNACNITQINPLFTSPYLSTGSPNSNDDDNNGLSTGAIAGISIAVIVVVGGAIAAVFWYFWVLRKAPVDQNSLKAPMTTNPMDKTENL